jgi:hypothetical protein
MRLTSLLAAGALAAAVSAPASAAFINGGISFSNGFDSTGTTTSIVSQLIAVNVATPNLAQGCAGDFGAGPCVPQIGNFAFDYDLSGGAQVLFSWGGFTFTVNFFGAPTRTALSCNANNQCTDGLRWDGVGIVSGNGFDPTEFLISWTATGNCTRNAGAGNVCARNVTASWAASITATGRGNLVPEPGSAALLGLGLGVLGWVSLRRKATA